METQLSTEAHEHHHHEDHGHEEGHDHGSEADSHSHESHAEHGEGVWESYIHVLTDPGHVLAELTFTLFFDLVIVALIYGILIKKVIIPRLRKDIHREFDKSHGISHSEDSELKND